MSKAKAAAEVDTVKRGSVKHFPDKWETLQTDTCTLPIWRGFWQSNPKNIAQGCGSTAEQDAFKKAVQEGITYENFNVRDGENTFELVRYTCGSSLRLLQKVDCITYVVLTASKELDQDLQYLDPQRRRNTLELLKFLQKQEAGAEKQDGKEDEEDKEAEKEVKAAPKGKAVTKVTPTTKSKPATTPKSKPSPAKRAPRTESPAAAVVSGKKRTAKAAALPVDAGGKGKKSPARKSASATQALESAQELIGRQVLVPLNEWQDWVPKPQEKTPKGGFRGAITKVKKPDRFWVQLFSIRDDGGWTDGETKSYDWPEELVRGWLVSKQGELDQATYTKLLHKK